ncbi:hypothetical protein ES708_28718 [subsurface metagenome]
MTVQAVIAGIKLTANKPLMSGFLEILYQHLIPLLKPDKLLCQLCPEALRVVNGPLVDLLIFFKTLDICLLLNFFRGGKHSIFCHHGGDGLFPRFILLH